MHKLLPLLALLVSSSALAGWTAKVNVDKMTDRGNLMVDTQSTRGVWAGKRALLAVAQGCDETAPTVLLSHPFVVGQGPVKVRVDQDEPSTMYAERKNGGKLFVIGDQGTEPNEVVGLVERLKTSKKVLIRYEVAGGKVEEAEFKTAGFASAYKSGLAKCPKKK